MGRGRAADDRDAAQGAKSRQYPTVLTRFRNAAMRPVVRRPAGSSQKGAMRRCRTLSIPSGIDRNRRLAWRLAGSNATPCLSPTASWCPVSGQSLKGSGPVPNL